MKHVFVTLALMGLVACQGPDSHSGQKDDMPMQSQAMTGIVISDAWVRRPLPGRDITAAYFHVINNSGMDDRLVSAASDISERVEIHTHLNEDGVMKMRQIDGLDIAQGGMAMFKPGGLHIMMFDVQLLEDQPDVALTLTFAHAGSQTIIAEIRDVAPEAMDHSGH